ncbi:hypothetical protein KKC94_00690 [Patescibacteria group bacterium]|nr:hypothetical protein [Patescibacteria group bacterium]
MSISKQSTAMLVGLGLQGCVHHAESSYKPENLIPRSLEEAELVLKGDDECESAKAIAAISKIFADAAKEKVGVKVGDIFVTTDLKNSALIGNFFLDPESQRAPLWTLVNRNQYGDTRMIVLYMDPENKEVQLDANANLAFYGGGGTNLILEYRVNGMRNVGDSSKCSSREQTWIINSFKDLVATMDAVNQDALND